MLDSESVINVLLHCIELEQIFLIEHLLQTNIFTREMINKVINDNSINMFPTKKMIEYLLNNELVDYESFSVLFKICIINGWIEPMKKIIFLGYNLSLTKLKLYQQFLLPDNLFEQTEIPINLTFDEIYGLLKYQIDIDRIKIFWDKIILTDEQIYACILRCFVYNYGINAYFIEMVKNPLIIYIILLRTDIYISGDMCGILFDKLNSLDKLSQAQILLLYTGNYMNKIYIREKILLETTIWNNAIILKKICDRLVSNSNSFSISFSISNSISSKTISNTISSETIEKIEKDIKYCEYILYNMTEIENCINSADYIFDNTNF